MLKNYLLYGESKSLKWSIMLLLRVENIVNTDTDFGLYVIERISKHSFIFIDEDMEESINKRCLPFIPLFYRTE